MNKIVRLCAIFFVSVVISGCMYVKVEKIISDDFAPKVNDSKVLLVEGDINRKYESIAFLNIIGSLGSKKEQLDKRIKKEARKAGGDAVLFVTYTKEQGYYPMVTGVIVIYNDDNTKK